MDNRSFFTQKSVVVILATLCCVLWGSAFPAIKNGYALFGIVPTDVASKMVFAGYRFLLAGLLVLIYAVVSGRHIFRLDRSEWRDAALLGILQTSIQYVFFYVGLAYTTGVKGSIMNATTAFFSVLLAHFVYHNDRMSLARIVGCLVGFAGVLVVNFGHGLIDFHFSLLGEGCVVVSALLLSIGGIFSKRVTQRMDSVVLTGHQLSMGGFILVAVGYASGGYLPFPTYQAAALMLYMVVISAAAFVLWTILLKYNRVGVVSVYNFLIPIFGALLSALFLDEHILEPKYALALVLVCAGIWLVNREPGRRAGPASS
ncbi:MAG: DMT family transporter [Rhodocyclaceae bacterium]